MNAQQICICYAARPQALERKRYMMESWEPEDLPAGWISRAKFRDIVARLYADRGRCWGRCPHRDECDGLCAYQMAKLMMEKQDG